MLHPEWLNQNENRTYPFAEDTSLVDSTGTITLPNGLVLDFITTVESTAGITLKLRSFTKVSTLFSFVIADEDDLSVATVSANADGHTYGQAYLITAINDALSARGKIVLGNLSEFVDEIPDGVYSFDGALFEACTVRPDLPAVRSLQAIDNFGVSDALNGHVNLIAGENIRLTYIESLNAIQIDAIPGEGSIEECDCEEEASTSSRIRTINGISSSNVDFVGGVGMAIRRSGNTLEIASPGVEPCCGCTEAEAVAAEFNILRNDTNKLLNYASNVENALMTVQNLLNSTR